MKPRSGTGVIRDRLKIRSALALVAFCLADVGLAQAAPDANEQARSAAEAIRVAAGADFAFLPEAHVREGRGLAEILQYPGDEIGVVTLTGAQVREALERAISLYPSDNPAFLYIAGLQASFDPEAAVDSRITSVSADEGEFSASAKYTVAMPSSLARGGLGYFKIWERQAEQRTVEGGTIEQILKGARAKKVEPRWHSGTR